MPAGRVLVVGGGVAGLSCAISMSGQGFAVDVVERSGVAEPESLNLNGRAVDGLADLGVLAECTAQAHSQSSPLFGHIYDSAGRRREVPRPATPRNLFPAAVVIYRPVLLDVLRIAAQKAGATIRQPRTVESIVQFAGTVLVLFDDGVTTEYDLVVGADGIRSTVRELVWGPEITPSYTGDLGIRWMAGEMPSGEPGFYYAPGKVVVVGRLNEETYVAASARTDETDVSQARARELLREVLSAYTAPYLRMLRDRIDERQYMVIRPWESLWVPDWYRERVILVGDAAHATASHMPVGAGMAVIDAVVLGEELGVADDIPAGLAGYVARRQERARQTVEASITVTRLQQAGQQQEAKRALASVSALLALPY